MEQLRNYIKDHPESFFIAGPKDQRFVDLAEEVLEVKLPGSFKEYLKEFGKIAFEGIEILGIKDEAYHNAGGINLIWFNLNERRKYDFPKQLIAFYNNDGVEYTCLDTSKYFSDDECAIVIWDNVHKQIVHSFEMSFIDHLLEEVEEALED